jgi:hypothetical protein
VEKGAAAARGRTPPDRADARGSKGATLRGHLPSPSGSAWEPSLDGLAAVATQR